MPHGVIKLQWINTLRHVPWFSIKMPSYQYRKYHCGDKTVVRSSYLYNGISFTGKMASFYWISPLMKHVYVSKLNIIGSDNGFLPDQGQANIWTNTGILETNFSEILIKTLTFSIRKFIWKWHLENGSNFNGLKAWGLIMHICLNQQDIILGNDLLSTKVLYVPMLAYC